MRYALAFGILSLSAGTALACAETLPEGATKKIAGLMCTAEDNESHHIRVYTTETLGEYLVRTGDVVEGFTGDTVNQDGGTYLLLSRAETSGPLGALGVSRVIGIAWDSDGETVKEAKLINKWNGKEYTCITVALRGGC